jgi:hypothetical protein
MKLTDGKTESIFLERTSYDKPTSRVNPGTPQVVTLTGRSTTYVPYVIGDVHPATITTTRMSGNCRNKRNLETAAAENADCIKYVNDD